MAKIEIKGATKIFEDKKSKTATAALYRATATVPNEKFTVILGKSGCGKTTLLRALAGLVSPEEGQILFDGKDVTATPPAKRAVGFVSQEYALYPHLTVFDNIAYPLKVAKTPFEEIRKRVNQISQDLGISLLLSRRTRALSGGQQQLVALARALVKNPSVLLMDEPLSNLDEQTRSKMIDELLKIKKLFSVTFVYVTHSTKEAYLLADYIAVMDNGEVVQEGFKEDVLSKKDGAFMRDFAPYSGLNI